MGVTFKTLNGILEVLVNSSQKYPIMLRSRHGVGKSTHVYTLAAKLGLKVIERRASQMTEGDLLGLPKVDGETTTWLPPDWLYEACQEPRMLFIDELDRGTQEVRQGFFELCDSRKIAGHKLHEKTLVFAAINGSEENSSQYQVGELDPAEIDRWTVFDLEPSVEDWLLWAKEQKLPKMIVDFIAQHPNHLEHLKDFAPSKVYPSRRSWARFSEVFNTPTLNTPGEHNSLLFNIANGFVGLEAATQLVDFVKNYQKEVSADDIVLHGKWKLTEKFEVTEHSAVIEKIKASGHLDKELDEKLLHNVANYILVLPKELGIALWMELSQGNPRNCINSVKLKELKEYVIVGVNGEEEKKEEEKEDSESAPKKRGRPAKK